MDFDIETVSDVLPLMLKMDEQHAIESLSKDLGAVKQSILDGSKIAKKGIRGTSVKNCLFEAIRRMLRILPRPGRNFL